MTEKDKTFDKCNYNRLSYGAGREVGLGHYEKKTRVHRGWLQPRVQNQDKQCRTRHCCMN